MKQKTLKNTDANGATKNVRDIQFWGDGDTFKLISKASSDSEGWMKSTKAMQVGASVVIQVTTQQINPDGSYAVAEALTTVKKSKIIEFFDNSGNVISRKITDTNTAELVQNKEIQALRNILSNELKQGNSQRIELLKYNIKMLETK